VEPCRPSLDSKSLLQMVVIAWKRMVKVQPPNSMIILVASGFGENQKARWGLMKKGIFGSLHVLLLALPLVQEGQSQLVLRSSPRVEVEGHGLPIVIHLGDILMQFLDKCSIMLRHALVLFDYLPVCFFPTFSSFLPFNLKLDHQALRARSGVHPSRRPCLGSPRCQQMKLS
jgi:hypothetical protein